MDHSHVGISLIQSQRALALLNLPPAAALTPSTRPPLVEKSMLPTHSLCSIIWLNRGIKLRKVAQSANTGQV